MSRRTICSAVALVVLAVLPVPTSPARARSSPKSTDKAAAAMQKGDFKSALADLRPLAAQGDADAQFLLGLLYDTGNGVARDPVVAAAWYRKAADQNHTLGRLYLGLLHYSGEGVKQSYEEAARWFRPAAEDGNDLAQFYLGWMYAQGTGVRKDSARGIEWLTRSARQRNPRAMGILTSELFSRHRDEQDLIDAYKWSHLAAEEDAVQAITSARALIEKYCNEEQTRKAKKAMTEQKREWAAQGR